MGDISGSDAKKEAKEARLAAERQAAKQRELLEAQQQKENLRKAEAESEVEKRKRAATAGKAGRQSLIKTSPTGLAQNLGGTTNAV